MKRSAAGRGASPLFIEGSAYVLGDYVDADAIIPVRYCTRPTAEILMRRCLTLIDPDFLEEARRGVIILAGRDFGRGSANENAVRALLLCGVRGVIAASFGLLFRRNAINMGLPIALCPRLVEAAETGDRIELDLINQRCADLTAGIEATLEPFSKIERDLMLAGGLVKWVKGRE